MSVHDLITLGEFRKALLFHDSTNSIKTNNKSFSKNDPHASNKKHREQHQEQRQRRDELLRLPLFLRLLSASQPLARIPTILPKTTNLKDKEGPPSNTSSLSSSPSPHHDHRHSIHSHRHADEIVPVLEKVAASFPLAEGVDVLVSYLAPQLCRSISRCVEVKRKRRGVFTLLGPSRSPALLLQRDDNVSNNIPDDNTPGYRKQQQGRVVIEGCLIPSSKYGGSFVISGFNTQELTAAHLNGGGKIRSKTKAKRPTPSSSSPTAKSPERKKKKKKRKLESPDFKMGTDKRMHTNHDSAATSIPTAAEDVFADAQDDDTGTIIDNEKSETISETSSSHKAAMIADEDSQESSVQRILAELVTLVLSSLTDVHVVHIGRMHHSNGTGGKEEEDKATMDEDPNTASSTTPNASPNKNSDSINNHAHYNNKSMSLVQNGGVALALKPDSLFTEPPTSYSNNNSNDNNSSNIDSSFFSNTDLDLSATIPCLMHHTPVLRHQHLSNALCRAADAAGAGASQIPEIIERCAANCPAVSQALVRGCLDAYSAATEMEEVGTGASAGYSDGNLSSKGMIKKCVKNSILAVANLSMREKSHVVFALNRSRILPDVMLELMIDMGKNGSGSHYDAVVLLLEDLLKYVRRRVTLDNGNTLLQSCNDDLSHMERNLRNNNNHTAVAITNNIISDGIKKRPPRRRRRIRQRRKTPSSQPPRYGEGLEEEWILHALRQDENLAGKTRRFLSLHIPFPSLIDNGGQKHDSKEKVVWGQAILHVRALALFVHLVGIGGDVVTGSSSSQFVESVMNSLTSLNVLKGSNSITPKISASAQRYEFLCVSVCACLLICSQLPPIPDNTDATVTEGESNRPTISTSHALVACGKCLCNLLHYFHDSITTEKRNKQQQQGNFIVLFLTRISSLIRDEDADGLRYLILKTLVYGSREEEADSFTAPPPSFLPPHILSVSCGSEGAEIQEKEGEVHKFRHVCQWLSSDPDVSKALQLVDTKVGMEPPLQQNVMNFVECAHRSQMNISHFDSSMSGLFKSADQCVAIYEDKDVALLLWTAVDLLAKRAPVSSIIPLVLPLDLEALCRAAYSKHKRHYELDNEGMGVVKYMCQFEIQVLYALLFMDRMPDSPFVIDPRALPLDLVLRRRFSIRKPRIRTQLETLIYKYYPESLDYTTEVPLLQPPHYSTTALVDATPGVVAKAIRNCALSSHDEYSMDDSEGLLAERLYLQACTCYPASKVDCFATAALIATYAKQSSLPGVAGSYAGLCRDPLLLLKCNVKTWKRKGLRRIILMILHRLLESNEVIVRESKAPDEVMMEYLAARDLIVLRCCLVVGSGILLLDRGGGVDFSKKRTGKIICPMIISTARFIVSKRPGLVAAAIKQGLPPTAVDWLVEYVPESLADAKFLTRMLEKRELTAVEKLGLGDAALRISIAHGSRNEADAQPMAYVALSLLVSSFFLVVGPVGVPVNITCEERSGQSYVSDCRKSMFRMISALQGITGTRTSLKSEALLALTKLAGLCKNDGNGSGLTGTAAKKRNILMKEIWDTLVRTICALGGGVQI